MTRKWVWLDQIEKSLKEKADEVKKKSYYNGYLQGVVDIFNIMLTTNNTDSQHIIQFDTQKINEIVSSLQNRIETTWQDGYMFYNEEEGRFSYSKR